MQTTKQLSQQVGVSLACRTMSLPRSSLYRARQPRPEPKPRPTPEHALSPDEQAEVRQELNSERFQDCAPRQVYARLLDEGRYLCHWRTMYRILKEHGEVQERRQPRRHAQYAKPALVAT